jgi:uncharacterized membrane protein YwaF
MQHWHGYNINFFTQNFHAIKFSIFVLLKFATKKKEQHNTCDAFQAEQLYSRICIQIYTTAFILVGCYTQNSNALTYTMAEASNLT